MRIGVVYAFVAMALGTLIGVIASREMDDHPPIVEPYLQKKVTKNNSIEDREDFSARGRKYIADFGESAYEMFYHLSNQLTYRELHGYEIAQTVEIDIVKLRESLFLVNWQQYDGAIVSQIIDFDYKTIYSIVVSADKRLIKSNGSLRVIS